MLHFLLDVSHPIPYSFSNLICFSFLYAPSLKCLCTRHFNIGFGTCAHKTVFESFLSRSIFFSIFSTTSFTHTALLLWCVCMLWSVLSPYANTNTVKKITNVFGEKTIKPNEIEDTGLEVNEWRAFDWPTHTHTHRERKTKLNIHFIMEKSIDKKATTNCNYSCWIKLLSRGMRIHSCAPFFLALYCCYGSFLPCFFLFFVHILFYNNFCVVTAVIVECRGTQEWEG